MNAWVVLSAVLEALLGGSLIALASWGAENVSRLITARQGVDDVDELVRPYLRGVLACRIVGTALVLLAVLVLADALV